MSDIYSCFGQHEDTITVCKDKCEKYDDCVAFLDRASGYTVSVKKPTKTIINNINCDWVNVKNKCRTTVGKSYTGSEPSSDFKTNLLISEHSPIRIISVDWSWWDIKSWVATHWSRHKWECFISSQRSDRTGVDRDSLPQDEGVNFDGVANVQQLIDTMRKRLCKGGVSPETYDLAVDLKLALMKSEYTELGEILVPNCVYRGGCPEFTSCKLIDCFISNEDSISEMLDIKWRYKQYNDWFLQRYDCK